MGGRHCEWVAGTVGAVGILEIATLSFEKIAYNSQEKSPQGGKESGTPKDRKIYKWNCRLLSGERRQLYAMICSSAGLFPHTQAGVETTSLPMGW